MDKAVRKVRKTAAKRAAEKGSPRTGRGDCGASNVGEVCGKAWRKQHDAEYHGIDWMRRICSDCLLEGKLYTASTTNNLVAHCRRVHKKEPPCEFTWLQSGDKLIRITGRLLSVAEAALITATTADNTVDIACVEENKT